ncbi:LysR substrate-binding domain-containing protein [Pusillimonas noertemannii]|uniref:DNA-binding transcriptional LysR family regulator n=1 Tax=Pusillimonas noertemannii TaxID=305977 RepID=A0A2U1CRC4_9BURK|nr:LysR substrate-binding domain-containing protein [Pusillimonas noertemannii]NYT67780.1 LysR family transcriptional regulator [Pusillimonas noertemannii]PVY68450.1 DNA-binding transcriptional LysR family regulator [Pusillimonas noertemannii]TFL12069.1 LysR family transcriptional regulator [Pusillimonas noertemannii]
MRHGIPNLGALQAFEATARLGSFSRAAEELSLTHSAVFRQVASLEERLGVQLFTRVRRRIALTDAGAEYAARVRHHLDQLEKDTFGLISRAGLGRSLHIAVLPTLATTWLVPRLPGFRRGHEDVSVSLSVRTRPFQFNDHPFDAAVYHALQIWPGTIGFKLFDEKELVPVCTPAVRQAIADHPEGMGGVSHLHMMSRPDVWRQWYREQGRDCPPSVGTGPRYELFTMLLAAAQAGMGVALVPGFLARQALAAGELTTAGEGVLPVAEAYYFSYPAQDHPSEALQAFEAWLRAEASGTEQ